VKVGVESVERKRLFVTIINLAKTRKYCPHIYGLKCKKVLSINKLLNWRDQKEKKEVKKNESKAF